MSLTPQSILVIGHSNIGDVCCDLAVVNPLRKKFPHARISFLTSARCEALAAHYNGIDTVIVMDKSKTDAGPLGRLPFIVSLRKQRFDLAIVLVNSLMHLFLGIPKVLALQKFFGGKVPKDVHIIDSYRAFFNASGIDFQDVVFDFNFEAKHAAFRDKFLEQHGILPADRVVGILPLAAWSLKNWPVDHWNRLIMLLEKDFKVIAFGKSGPDELSGLVLKNLSKDIISAIDKTNLAQALALIGRCDYFIGPDSGLLHLASCMNVNTIGLYGATSKDFIYPYFHRGQIIASRAQIPCMPCYPGGAQCQRRGKSLCGQCMEEIGVEEVASMVR